MDQTVELIVGVSFFIIGLSMICNQINWIEFVNYCEKEGNWAILLIGFADLLIGGSILALHWIWYGLSALTTLIGCALFIRGTMRLLFPNRVRNKIYDGRGLVLCGAASIMVSIFILYGWYVDSFLEVSYGNLY